MNIFKTGICAAMMAATVVGCAPKRQKLVPMPKEYVSQKLVQSVNSLYKEGTAVKYNTKNVLLDRDTVKLDRDFVRDPDSFYRSTNSFLSQNYNETICPEDEGFAGKGYFDTQNYYDKYINKQAIVSGKNLYTTDSIDVYVPVEYYGEINPEIKDFI